MNAHLRIATWNLRRPRMNDSRLEFFIEQIQEVNADIWIFTESNDCICPGHSFDGSFSTQIKRVHAPGETRTAVWSRIPIQSTVLTHDRDTAVCLDINSPLGPLLIYGTVIPYGNAGTQYLYRSGGMDVGGQHSWQLHAASIQRHKDDLERLRQLYPDHVLCFGGDFNQHRFVPLPRLGETKAIRRYGTNAVREMLSICLEDTQLQCVTEKDFRGAGMLSSRSTVDHICIDHRIRHRLISVGAWEAARRLDGQISDHNGVYVDLASA